MQRLQLPSIQFLLVHLTLFYSHLLSCTLFSTFDLVGLPLDILCHTYVCVQP
jgi:hypothetical protein